MSYESDKRVVELQFNNKRFEADVGTTISTLDKLQNKLKFEGASKGFDELERAAKKIDFEHLLKSIDSIADRFTLKGTIIRKFFDDIADKALSLGRTLDNTVMSMTGLNQIGEAWDKYAQKTSAVQTIMGAVASEVEDVGERMEYVNGQLKMLSWFTDETSYNFLDMVNNIGKFTSNQVPLEQAVSSMQGIATWAAKSGANVTEAGRAMYNLSQAISAGALKLMDWKSIELANMATAEFKQTAIETGEQMGTLIKVTDDLWQTIDGTKVSIKSFRESLADGWLSSEVLLGTLEKYGGFTQELNNAFRTTGLLTSDLLQAIDDYKAGIFDVNDYMEDSRVSADELSAVIEKLSQDQYDFGRAAFKAAQEAKTFQEAVDSVKEAVASGWMESFELIFGNYQEAKRLWTDLANYLYDVFNRNAQDRNEMLATWKDLGGRTDLFEGLYNIVDGLTEIFEQVGRAWRDVFPAVTWYDLIQLTRRFKAFTETVRLNEEQLDRLRSVFVKIFTPIKYVTDAVILMAKWLITIAVVVGRAVKSFLDGILAFEDFGKAMDYLTKKYPVLGHVLTAISYAIEGVIGVLGAAIVIFRNFGQALMNVAGVQNFLGALKNVASVMVGVVIVAVQAFAHAIEQCVAFMTEHVFTVKMFEAALNGIATAFGVVGMAIAGVWNWCGRLFERLRGISSVREFLTAIAEHVKETFQQVADSHIGQTISNTLKNIFSHENAKAIQNMTSSVHGFFEELSTGQTVALIFAGIIGYVLISVGKLISTLGNLAKALTGIGDVFGAVTGWFKAMTRATKYSALIQIGTGILMIAGAIAILANTAKSGYMEQAVVALMAVTAVAALLVTVMTMLMDSKAKMAAATSSIGSGIKTIGSAFQSFFDSIKGGIMIVSIAGSILMLAHALQVLGNVQVNWAALGELALTIGMMVGALAALAFISKTIGRIEASAASMLAFAVGVYTLVKAFEKLQAAASGLGTDTLYAMIEIIMGYATALALFGKFGGKGGVAAIMAVGSMYLFVRTLEKLGRIKIPSAGEFIKLILSWLAVVVPIGLLSSRLLTVAGALAISVGALWGAFLLVQQFVIWSRALEYHEFENALGALAAMLGVVEGISVLSAAIFALATRLSGVKNFGRDLWKSIIAMALNVLAVAAALKMLVGIPWNDILPAAASLGGCIAILAIAMASASKIGDAKAIKAMVANIAAITIALIALSFFRPEQIIWPAGALMIALAGLATAFAGVGAVADKINTKSIIAMVAAIVLTAGSLVALVKFSDSWEQIIAAGGAMAAAFAGFYLMALAAERLQAVGIVPMLANALIAAGLAYAVGKSLSLFAGATPDAGVMLAAGGALGIAAVLLATAANIIGRTPNMLGSFATMLSAAALAVAIGYSLSSMAAEGQNIETAAWAFAGAVTVLVAAVELLGATSGVSVAGAGVLDLIAAAAAGFGWAMDKFGEGVQKFGDGIQTITNSLTALAQLDADQVGNVIKMLVDLVGQMALTLMTESSKVQAAAEYTGQCVVAGIQKGVLSNLSSLSALGVQAWETFHGSFTAAALIQSPSKVMEQDGVYIAYGLVNGVMQQQGTIEDLGSGTWVWFHDGASEVLPDVVETETKFYCGKFEAEIVKSAPDIEDAGKVAAAASGDEAVQGVAAAAGQGVGQTVVGRIGSTIEAGAGYVRGKAQSMLQNAFGGIDLKGTFNSMWGNTAVFLSEADEKNYKQMLHYGASKQDAIAKLGYDPYSKLSVTMKKTTDGMMANLGDVGKDVGKSLGSVAGGLGDIGSAGGSAAKGAGKASKALSENTEALEKEREQQEKERKELEALLTVTNYAGNAAEYFYEQSDRFIRLYDKKNLWGNAIKSTEDLILENYKLRNSQDEAIQGIKKFGDMNLEQARAAKEAWTDYFDNVSGSISKGFGSVFAAPAFATANALAEVQTTSYDAMMKNLKAQEEQMDYFVTTLVRLRSQGLNDTLIEELLDAGPENLEQIKSWRALSTAEVQKINAQYEAFTKATTKGTMDYIRATSKTFGSMPESVMNAILDGVSTMSMDQVETLVRGKTDEILQKVIDAEGNWEQFSGSRLGELLDEGLASGITDMKEVAVKAVERLAQEMIGQLRKEMEEAKAEEARSQAAEWNKHVQNVVGSGGKSFLTGGFTSSEEATALKSLTYAKGFLEYVSGGKNYDPSHEAKFIELQNKGYSAASYANEVLSELDKRIVEHHLGAANLAASIESTVRSAEAASSGSSARYSGSVSGSVDSGYKVNITQNNYSTSEHSAETMTNQLKSIASKVTTSAVAAPWQSGSASTKITGSYGIRSRTK